MSDKTRVLFLCTGNSCRSQMAEGFARNLAGHLIEPKSAGLEAHGINPRAAQVMKEDWVDISGQESTVVTDEMIAEADLVITLCDHAQDHCPALPANVEHRHWPTEDPAQAEGSEEEIMSVYRRVQDEIKENILFLMNEVRGDIHEF